MGIYAKEDPVPLFKDYLDRGEKSRAFPVWWNSEKRKQVVRMSLDKESGKSINDKLLRLQVIENYGGDNIMPLKLRALSEKVYGEFVRQV
jgi:hypothetical protein